MCQWLFNVSTCWCASAASAPSTTSFTTSFRHDQRAKGSSGRGYIHTSRPYPYAHTCRKRVRTVSAGMPHLQHRSTSARSDATPAEWPANAPRPRASAQRALPSMMTWHKQAYSECACIHVHGRTAARPQHAATRGMHGEIHTATLPIHMHAPPGASAARLPAAPPASAAWRPAAARKLLQARPPHRRPLCCRRRRRRHHTQCRRCCCHRRLAPTALSHCWPQDCAPSSAPPQALAKEARPAPSRRLRCYLPTIQAAARPTAAHAAPPRRSAPLGTCVAGVAHKWVYAWACACVHAHAPACACARVHAHAPAGACARVRALEYACIHALLHACVCACVNGHVRAAEAKLVLTRCLRAAAAVARRLGGAPQPRNEAHCCHVSMTQAATHTTVCCSSRRRCRWCRWHPSHGKSRGGSCAAAGYPLRDAVRRAGPTGAAVGAAATAALQLRATQRMLHGSHAAHARAPPPPPPRARLQLRRCGLSAYSCHLAPLPSPPPSGTLVCWLVAAAEALGGGVHVPRGTCYVERSVRGATPGKC
eukprot:354422-Chlamydomonas_euryale.AAC.3